MHHEWFPLPGKPTLVCVPGLLGGPEDFRGIRESIQTHFQALYVDPNRAKRDAGLNNLSLEETKSVSYDSSAPEIQEVLSSYGVYSAYFLGVSLGGKIVYDYAIRFPEQFLGAVISDVGPSSFIDSELYHVVNELVQLTDLSLPWDELKLRLRENIADRNLRSLIQSQVFYPAQKPPGIWKTGMKGLGTLLRRNSIDDQTTAFGKANQKLIDLNRKITVLQASQISGITPEGITQIKKEWNSIHLVPIAESGHFLHVTHKDELEKAVLTMV